MSYTCHKTLIVQLLLSIIGTLAPNAQAESFTVASSVTTAIISSNHLQPAAKNHTVLPASQYTDNFPMLLIASTASAIQPTTQSNTANSQYPSKTPTKTPTDRPRKRKTPPRATVNIIDKRYKKGKITAVYPQFQGIRNPEIQRSINTQITGVVNQFVQTSRNDRYLKEAKITYKLHYLSTDKVSFELNMYSYSGGAHGTTVVKGYNYDLKNGEQYSFSKMFSYDNTEINQAILQQTQQQQIPLFEDFQGIIEYPQNFYLDQDARPVILFQQYEIAPYSSGVIRIKM